MLCHKVMFSIDFFRIKFPLYGADPPCKCHSSSYDCHNTEHVASQTVTKLGHQGINYVDQRMKSRDLNYRNIIYFHPFLKLEFQSILLLLSQPNSITSSVWPYNGPDPTETFMPFSESLKSLLLFLILNKKLAFAQISLKPCPHN